VTSATAAPYNLGMVMRAATSLAILWLALAPAGAAAQALDAACRAAVTAAAAGRWAEATRCTQPVPSKVILWLRLVSGPASAGELAAFVAENPDWPLAATLARRAEATHAQLLDDAAVRRFFARRPPQTDAGMLRLAEAVETTNAAEATRLRRAAWIEMRPDAAAERAFLDRYGGAIRPEDHWARFDRLTWSRETAAAQRILASLPAGRQVAARARLEALSGNEGDLVQMQEARRDPLVFLERARSLRRQDRDDEALRHWMADAAAAQSAAGVDRLPQFWAERQILIRRLLRRAEDARARELAAAHGLPPGPTEAYLEAEFMAGWISLRRRGEPARALAHFTALERAAVSPISVARGGYWRGRALAALQRPEDARAAWRAAAEHPFTFYGQLAALAAGESEAELALRIAATAPPAAEPAHVAAFANRELAEAARIFVAIGDERRARQVLLRMAEIAPDPVDRGLVGSLAVALGQAETGVWIARRVAASSGTVLPDAGWPTPVEPPPGIERALAFALMRQESNFEAGAVSPAGARGLMQLMPATARAMARELNDPSLANRLNDPQANMRLGTAYLAKRLDEFEGAVPLALAAYNAGAHRVRQWLDQNGDPRTSNVDPIDWIELIPFSETRNYVMRVVESVLVYRARVGGAEASARHPVRTLAAARP
jgi:soluble lytic murein transglycosylase